MSQQDSPDNKNKLRAKHHIQSVSVITAGFSLSSTCWRDGHHQVWLRVSGPVHPGGAGQSWGQNLSSSSTPNCDNHFVTEIIYNCALKCFCHDPTNIVNKSIQRWFMCVWVQSTYFRPYWIKLLSNTVTKHNCSQKQTRAGKIRNKDKAVKHHENNWTNRTLLLLCC